MCELSVGGIFWAASINDRIKIVSLYRSELKCSLVDCDGCLFFGV